MESHNTRSTDQIEATILLAVAMALSGTAGVFSTQTGQPTLNIVFFRCLFGAIFLLGWCLCRGKARTNWRIERRLLPLAVISGLCLVLNWAALFEAFHLTSIGFATIIYHIQPFWIVLAGALFLGEPLSRDKFVWLLAAFAGLVLVIGPRVGNIMSDGGWMIGVGCAVVASLLYAGSTLTARRLKAVDPAVLTILHCCIGMAILGPLLSVAAILSGPITIWGWLAGLGIIHTGVVYVLLYQTYPKLQTAVIAVCAFLNPVTALLSDYLFYSRSINLLQAVGICLILVSGLGVTLNWKILAPGKQPQI